MAVFTSEEYDQAIVEALQILYQRSKEPEYLITYKELAEQIHAVRFEPYEYQFHSFLGDLSTQEFNPDGEHHRPLLTALVVYGENSEGQGRPGWPGGQFWTLAESLGLEFTDPDQFWFDQIEAIRAYPYHTAE